MSFIENAVFYHIYPLGFCGALSAERDGVNRIRKIAEWIPHFKELGINALYLGPVFESVDHGYDTVDYRVIDRRLGSNADFSAVCDELHKNGIAVVLDGVFNHVGRGFFAFLDVKEKGAASEYAGWFAGMNFGWGNSMGDSFSYEGWNGHLNLVKLNLKNPAVADYLIDSVKFWMSEWHIDGLRLDAADCVDHDFWRRLHRETKAISPDFWLMGEIIHGNYAVWANPEMLDSVTNYECYKGLYSSHNDKNLFEIAHSIRRQRDIYKGINLYNFLDNHDVNRIGSTLRRKEHLFTIYTLLMGMAGVPSVYYGSEWGIEGVKSGGSDLPMRPCLELDSINGNDELCRHVAKLCHIRRENPALYKGSYDEVYLRNEQYVFRRSGDGQSIYVAVNIADRPAEIRFQSNCNALYDLLCGRNYPAGNVCINMPPFSSMLLMETNGEFEDIAPEVASAAAPSPAKAEERPAPAPAPAPEAPKSAPEAPKPAPEAPKPAPEAPRPARMVTEAIDHRRYRHFKGGMYEVVAVAVHTETGEEFVVYRDLYDWSKAWARPKAEFCGEVELDGRWVPRFTMM